MSTGDRLTRGVGGPPRPGSSEPSATTSGSGSSCSTGCTTSGAGGTGHLCCCLACHRIHSPGHVVGMQLFFVKGTQWAPIRILWASGHCRFHVCRRYRVMWSHSCRRFWACPFAFSRNQTVCRVDRVLLYACILCSPKSSANHAGRRSGHPPCCGEDRLDLLPPYIQGNALTKDLEEFVGLA